MIRRFIIATLLLLAATTAQAGLYTDIWYRLGQPGFGYNLVQTDDYIFVTFFIYGPDGGKPTWYIAALQRQNDGTFTGELSETRGTFWAVPWAGTRDRRRTATFAPNTDNYYEGTFSYSVPGVGSSTIPVTRQTLLSQDLTGDYAGGMGGQYGSCDNSADDGAYRDYYDLTVTQLTLSDATFQFDFTRGRDPELRCRAIVQNGLLYRIPNATYSARAVMAPRSTAAQMTQIKWTAQGSRARPRADHAGRCQEFGYFSAAFVGRRGPGSRGPLREPRAWRKSTSS
jgi:hypothetical protein